MITDTFEPPGPNKGERFMEWHDRVGPEAVIARLDWEQARKPTIKQLTLLGISDGVLHVLTILAVCLPVALFILLIWAGISAGKD